jgi:hypothetical protein
MVFALVDAQVNPVQMIPIQYLRINAFLLFE